MENPATWSEAERIVDDVVGAWLLRSARVRAGDEEPHMGYSLAKQVTNALRQAGLLNDK